MRRAVLLLSGVGILVSAYLSWLKLTGAEAFCAGIGGCETVNTSAYAEVFGIPQDHIRVIDTDLGRTGRSAEGRAGFQELVALVNQGQVGIIFAYDVTRLARNCTDWYALLDLCGWRHCLVGDQDGISDPATPNGRLILGLK